MENGTPAGADARADLPGHQVTLANGCATFSVRVNPDNKYDTATVFVYLYADPEETALIGSASFVLEVVPVPADGALFLVLTLPVAAGIVLRYRTARGRRLS